jgi:hypothetical protein
MTLGLLFLGLFERIYDGPLEEMNNAMIHLIDDYKRLSRFAFHKIHKKELGTSLKSTLQ